MTYFVEGLTILHGGESIVRRIGEYETLKDAVMRSQQVIDDFLIAKAQDGMTAADLFSQYQEFGEVPFIFSDDVITINRTGFNHFQYSMMRCRALCNRNEGKLAG
jgi:hypothetical protein